MPELQSEVSPRSKRPYREGDWVWIPVGRSGLNAVGRIGRVAPIGGGILFYGFGPARRTVPTPNDLNELKPATAVLIRMCGDLGILNHEWKVIPYTGFFDRREWRMPHFGQRSDPGSPGIRVEYPEDAPNTEPLMYRVTYDEARALPDDGLDGYRLVEERMADALHVRWSDPEPGGGPMLAQHFVYFPSERIAKSAAEQMRRAIPGASTEIRESDNSWLVLLTHSLAPGPISFEEIGDRLTRIAAQRHGDYDGWERDT